MSIDFFVPIKYKNPTFVESCAEKVDYFLSCGAPAAKVVLYASEVYWVDLPKNSESDHFKESTIYKIFFFARGVLLGLCVPPLLLFKCAVRWTHTCRYSADLKEKMDSLEQARHAAINLYLNANKELQPIRDLTNNMFKHAERALQQAKEILEQANKKAEHVEHQAQARRVTIPMKMMVGADADKMATIVREISGVPAGTVRFVLTDGSLDVHSAVCKQFSMLSVLVWPLPEEDPMEVVDRLQDFPDITAARVRILFDLAAGLPFEGTLTELEIAHLIRLNDFWGGPALPLKGWAFNEWALVLAMVNSGFDFPWLDEYITSIAESYPLTIPFLNQKMPAFITYLEQKDLPAAKVLLGLCYFIGCGVDKSLTKAQECFQAAADVGHPRGTVLLGYCWVFRAFIQEQWNQTKSPRCYKSWQSTPQWGKAKECRERALTLDPAVVRDLWNLKQINDQYLSINISALRINYQGGYWITLFPPGTR